MNNVNCGKNVNVDAYGNIIVSWAGQKLERCPAHGKYAGAGRPTSQCGVCKQIYRRVHHDTVTR